MRAAEFLDGLLEPKSTEQALRELTAMTAGEKADVRNETLARLIAGDIQALLALTILAVVGLEGIEPDLLRLLRSPGASLEARAAAVILLRRTGFDVVQELDSLDRQSRMDLIEEVLAVDNAIRVAAQKDTPFEAIAAADPEDDEVDIDEVVDDLLEAFLASPEAAEAADADELRLWVDAFVRYGVVYGLGSPDCWDSGSVDELVTEILPRKITIESAADAAPAVPAFRTFFRWASRVASVPLAGEIDAFLQQVEPEFAAMMMDERRFGPAKSFALAGTAAGFDMSTEDGMRAFQQQWNEQQALPRPFTSNTKTDAAKKRKAKMAKLSRRKNRRRK
ncbi:MAG TPA: hypothetical protein VF883_07730 [Thermoanaerobaculia bacterium]|jgi:hypothetical protein